MNNKTAFLWDERCFWHYGGNYALLAPVGGLVQPMVSGGLPEAPETKRRLKNLMDVTGLSNELAMRHAEAASITDLLRVHPQSYLDKFKSLSDQGGGELGLRTPFGKGAFEIAALSAGLVTEAVKLVLTDEAKNEYFHTPRSMLSTRYGNHRRSWRRRRRWHEYEHPIASRLWAQSLP